LWVVEFVVVVQALHLQAPEVSWLSWSSETGAKVSGIVVLASESQTNGRGGHSKKKLNTNTQVLIYSQGKHDFIELLYIMQKI